MSAIQKALKDNYAETEGATTPIERAINGERNTEFGVIGSEHNCTFLNYRAAIERYLMDKGLFDPAWWDSQRERINMMWLAGEPVWMAQDTMAVFAEGQKASFNFPDPLDPKICIGIKEI